jgi:hypothetical protein
MPFSSTTLIKKNHYVPLNLMTMSLDQLNFLSKHLFVFAAMKIKGNIMPALQRHLQEVMSSGGEEDLALCLSYRCL